MFQMCSKHSMRCETETPYIDTYSGITMTSRNLIYIVFTIGIHAKISSIEQFLWEIYKLESRRGLAVGASAGAMDHNRGAAATAAPGPCHNNAQSWIYDNFDNTRIVKLYILKFLQGLFAHWWDAII